MKKAASKARPTMTRMTRSMVPSLVVNMALSCADGDAGNTLAARGRDRIDLEQALRRWPGGAWAWPCAGIATRGRGAGGTRWEAAFAPENRQEEAKAASHDRDLWRTPRAAPLSG